MFLRLPTNYIKINFIRKISIMHPDNKVFKSTKNDIALKKPSGIVTKDTAKYFNIYRNFFH